ncbi:MAG: HEPN domain-containing protein [Nitrososphaeria archaeon]|nr:HEPN domain-containing protein [Nitrososphaeria archaeon]MDW7985852.1 HEPN domain-containing protein [Nitrososphaerota archaeon]
MRDEASRWLEEAEKDLETADLLCRNARYNAACFYAHQAAEKAVKAMLYSVNEAPWGHSIRILLERYREKTNSSKVIYLMECARELDRHYIPSRYPNAHPSGTAFEAYDLATAEKAIECSREILNYARGEIR